METVVLTVYTQYPVFIYVRYVSNARLVTKHDFYDSNFMLILPYFCFCLSPCFDSGTEEIVMADDLEQQNNNGLQGSESNDRLSSLHDSILHHILSFRPTSDVVRTGILSKRWKSLWIGVSIFDIDDLRCSSTACWNFVERVLVLRNRSSIKQFKLWLRSYATSGYPRVQSIISSLVSHEIPHLDISLCVGDQFTLPSSIFDSQSLCILKLSILKKWGSLLTLELPVHISLPCLKVLHLRDFAFPNAESIEKLFSCCPVLEELALVECKWIHRKSMTISIPSLKRLKYDFVDDHNSCRYIKVEAPALRSFNYRGTMASPLYLSNMSSIQEFKLSYSRIEPSLILRSSRVQSLVAAVVSHKVEQLDITIDVKNPFTLPCTIFQCQSLRSLKISLMNDTLMLPDQIYLPCLKVMHLRHCEFQDVNSIEKLFSGCPVLEKFTLEGCKFIRLNRINMSILSASHKVQQLDIRIDVKEDPFTVPCPIFDCQSLCILKLSLKNITLELPDHISLPCLKMMQLCFCEFQNANSIEKLFSCCHVLEELTLMDCKWIHFNSITISIPSLKRLTMGVEEYSLVDDDNSCYITIESPALSSFNYTGFLTNHFYFTKISSLSIKAYIHIRNYRINRGVRALHLVKFFQGLENMVSLTISNETAEELSQVDTVPDQFPVFHHLKYLNLSMKVKGSVLSGLLKFFYFMPNLGTIEFLEGVHKDIRISGLKPPKALPNCFLSSLKDLRLKKFRGDGHEFYFLTSFLRKVVSLQRINITTYGYINRQQLMKKVEDLSTRFKHCAIIVQ